MDDKPGRPTLYDEAMVVKAVSINQEQVKFLDGLVKEKRYKSLAEAVRAAVDLLHKKLTRGSKNET